MAHIQFAVSQAGLAVPALIGPHGGLIQQLLANGQPVPAPVAVRGLLDTGSSVTAVAPWVLRRLGLSGIGVGASQTASGSVPVDIYEVSIAIIPSHLQNTPDFTLPRILVSELVARLTDADVLIGLNVLLNCKFTLDGPGQQFVLEF